MNLVFGASGTIGTHLVPYLADHGWPVRAVARRVGVLEARGWRGVSIRSADALEPASLPPVFEGVRTAYYLVHSMAAGRSFGALDVQAAEHFATAAERAGVERIVYLGGLVPPDASSEHIVSRRETGEVLRQRAVPVTELRAGIIVGPGSAAFEVMRDLVFHLPVMLTPRWIRASSPPIALANLLVYLARIPDVPEAAGRVFDAAGPDVLTYQQMMNILAEVAGRRRPIVIPVPLLSPQLSAWWLRFVTAVPTNVARALIGGLRHDFTADTAALEALVPQRLMTFREAVEAVFEAEREHGPQARWVEGALPLRRYRIDYAYYAKRTGAVAVGEAPVTAHWTVLSRIGGGNRYYTLNWLWALREWLDWLVGGPGRRRGREDPEALRAGERVDSWEVLGVDPPHRLSLHFGMRAPGAGILEFGLTPDGPQRTRLAVDAYWHPAGFWGILYWYALLAPMSWLLRRLARRICALAEAEA